LRSASASKNATTASGVTLQVSVFEAMLIDCDDDRSQQGPERLRDGLKLLVERIVQDFAVHIAHQVDKAALV